MYKFASKEFDYAYKLVNALCDAGLSSFCECYGENSFSKWYDSKKLAEYGVYYENGASKVCLYQDEISEYVIKFGFVGSKKDYCQIECENYRKAVEAGLERYFPYTEELCVRDGIHFFIQEKAVCDEEAISSEWFSEMNEAMSDYRDDYESEDEYYSYVWDAVAEMSDEERVNTLYGDEELLDFLYEMDINDLHEGNFGMIGDRVVIIDFSGWRG